MARSHRSAKCVSHAFVIDLPRAQGIASLQHQISSRQIWSICPTLAQFIFTKELQQWSHHSHAAGAAYLVNGGKHASRLAHKVHLCISPWDLCWVPAFVPGKIGKLLEIKVPAESWAWMKDEGSSAGLTAVDAGNLNTAQAHFLSYVRTVCPSMRRSLPWGSIEPLNCPWTCQASATASVDQYGQRGIVSKARKMHRFEQHLPNHI